MQTSLSKHVPELDGLRGIAIILVIIHHQLTPFSLAGGFLGVDLFFVLSGFLITGLLLTEFDKTKTISLPKFYMRRVLRLGPALFLYLLGCLIVTWHTQLIAITRELKLVGIALAYSTNWRMAFGWDTSLDPTAIIWSLSIEEQFYLAWPLLFFCCLKLKLRRSHIITGLAVIILSIMAHRVLLMSAGAALTRLYYGTDTRADALLVGCLFALLPGSFQAEPRPRVPPPGSPAGVGRSGRTLGINARTWINGKTWLNLAGILAAAGLCYLFASSSFGALFLYRGGYTGVALLTGILIFAVTNASSSPMSLLALTLRLRLLRWFGKISYGLYLWHWLVVRSTSFYYLGYWEPWARLALAVGIASASFYLVEKPFTRMKTRYAAHPADSQAASSVITTDQAPSSLPIPVTNY